MTTCSTPSRSIPASCIALALLLHGAGAAAQPSAQDQATARALFNEARALMKAGRHDQACPKLEAASKLYPGSGVLLNLGDCYEHVGRTASAWTEFGEAASAAEEAGRADDLAEARRRQAAIEPRLSRLVIRVPHPAPGLVVRRDGSVIDRGAWGEGIPVDPGPHALLAEAPEHQAWSSSVSVAGAGHTATVEVPDLPASRATPDPLATLAQPPAKSPQDAPPERAAPYWDGRKVASASIAGLGVAGLTAAALIVAVAKSQDDNAQNEPNPQRHNDSQNAANLGDVATVLSAVGGALAAGGLLLWWTAPSAPAQVGLDVHGVVVRGTF
jgi:hypothetical protein